jgi:hypothetical protein
VRAEAAAADAAIARVRRSGLDRAGQFKSAEAMREFHAALDAKRRADARAPHLAAFNARLRTFLDRRCGGRGRGGSGGGDRAGGGGGDGGKKPEYESKLMYIPAADRGALFICA